MTTTTGQDDAADPRFVELGDGTIEAELPADLSSVRLARHYVHQRWSQVGEDALDDVDLIVSELVANAVEHGSPDIVFRVRAEPFAIDIEVLDHGAAMPSLNAGEDGRAARGRGLHIVDRLAAKWGYERLSGETGKVVWASVDLAGSS